MVAGGHVCPVPASYFHLPQHDCNKSTVCQNFCCRSCRTPTCSQIFKKAAYVKRRRQIVSLLGCGWRQILGRQGSVPEQTQSRHSPEGTVGHRCTPEQGHCGGTASHSNPTLGWRNTSESKKQQTLLQSPALPLTSPKGLGVYECNLANSR